jgi:steroid 5-alpha reductase family enzyme
MPYFLLTLGVFSTIIVVYVTIVFMIAQIRQDNSVMDIFYGPAFAVGMWATMFLTNQLHVVSVLVAGLLTLWAARLSIRIARKNWGKAEDERYAAWRRDWTARGKIYFIVRSYLQINLLQGVIIVLVSTPLILIITFGYGLFMPLFYLGCAIFFLGLGIEATADAQLDRFIRGKIAGTETATLMTQGLFHYSRRPNYFGESLIWWGFAVIASSTPLGALAIISPLLITYILTKVTGPMLEAIFLKKYPEEYRAYMERTSYFFPLPPHIK